MCNVSRHAARVIASLAALVAGALAPGSRANADTSGHFRLLVHGTASVPEGRGFGIAAWLVAPDATSSPVTWLGIVGARYARPTWDLELMGGGYVSSAQAISTLDARFELTALLPYYLWANVEYIDLFAGRSSQVYLYLQSDFAIRRHGAVLALVGVETEDLFGGGVDDTSVGPHVFVPVGPFVFQIAYQHHTETASDALWLRVLFSFHPSEKP